MVSRTRLLRAVMALSLVASGIAAAEAARHGLYANTLLACCAALWLGLLSVQRDPLPAGPDVTPPDVRAIHAELRRLRFTVDHAPVPLLLVAVDGVLHAVNKAARAMFVTDDRIVDAPAPLAAALARSPPAQRTILKLAGRAPGVPERSYALSVASWSGGDGPGLLAALIDIQPELQAAEAAALRELLQILSHEIMNSLTPVMSLAETAVGLLAETSPGGITQARDALETIARRARGLDRFVQGYRALARVPAPLPRATSVCLLLRDLALLFETAWRAAGVTLELACPDPDIVATIDPDLLGQALTALLTNGAEAALAFAERPPAVTLAAGIEAGQLWLRVTDSGAGVLPEHAEAIFRPLFTLKPNGTGIGLGLARQIALAHGGALTLEPPATGGGAVFRLTLG